MPSINQVTLMGHLGRDAETQTFRTGGDPCTKFSLDTTRRWKEGQEWKEATDWHNVVAWKVSEKTVAELRKGALVYVQGRLQTRSWEKDGEKRYSTEVVADRVYYLRDANQAGPPPRPAKPTPATTSTEISDDEIPF